MLTSNNPLWAPRHTYYSYHNHKDIAVIQDLWDLHGIFRLCLKSGHKYQSSMTSKPGMIEDFTSYEAAYTRLKSIYHQSMQIIWC